MIRVYIDSASAVTRSGLEALLESQSEIEIVNSGQEADVVLRDHPEEVLNHSDGPAVVLLGDEFAVQDGLRAGAHAVLGRNASPAQIIAAIIAVAAGLIAIPAGDGARTIVNQAPIEELTEPLTSRELEVLDMLAEGLSNKLIAYRLSISEHTAKFHVNSIFAKLRAGTRTEAVTRGLRLGLIKL